MTWLASKGAFTSDQWQAYTDVIVNGAVLGLTMFGAVLWHYLEAAYLKVKHTNAGFAAGVNSVPTPGPLPAEPYEPAPKNTIPQPPAPFTGLPTTKAPTPTVDSAGNLTFTPPADFHKGTASDPFPPVNKP
jgi:hypothetical protein